MTSQNSSSKDTSKTSFTCGRLGGAGEEFQRLFALMLLQRATRERKTFNLAFECKEGVKFDDVVLHLAQEKKWWLFQNKHFKKKDQHNISRKSLVSQSESNDFALAPYIEAYQRVMQDWEHNDDEKWFCLFTNVTVNEEDGLQQEVEVDGIINFGRGRFIQFKGLEEELAALLNSEFYSVGNSISAMFDEGKVDDVLEKYKDNLRKIITVEENEVKLTSNSSCETFFLSALMETHPDLNNRSTNATNVVQFWNDTNSSYVEPLEKKSKNEAKNQLPTLTTRESIEEFFKVFIFAHSQPDVDDLARCMFNEGQIWMRGRLEPDILGRLTKCQIMQFLHILKDKFSDWEKSIQNTKTFLRLDTGTKYLEAIEIELRNEVKMYTNPSCGRLENRYYIKRKLFYQSNNDHTELDETKFIRQIYSHLDPKNCFIIVADPGMGKSMLMQSMAFEAQKTFPETAVFLMFLNHFQIKLKSDKIDPFSLEVFLESRLSPENVDLVMKNKDCPKVLFMDGFDELSEHNQGKVLKLIDDLRKINIMKIVITCRNDVKESIQTRLNGTTIFMKHFNKDEQEQFLKLFLEFGSNDDTNLKEFSKEILSKINNGIDYGDYKFTGTPMTLSILAEIILPHFQVYCQKKPPLGQFIHGDEFNANSFFDQLVTKFIQITMNRRFNASNDFESNHFFNATFKAIDYDYQILAAKRMFSEKLLLFMENDLFKTVEERIGKQHHHLVKIESNVLEFSHPAYGEYYAAKFLFEYVGRASISFCTPEILEDLKNQQNVRNFFFGMINSIPNVAETTTENNNQLKLLQDLGQEVLFWSCEKDFVNVLKHLRKKYNYKMIKCQNRSLQSVAKSNKAIKIQNYLTKEIKCNPETDETNSEAIIPNVEPSTSSSSQRQTNSSQKSAATQKRKSGKITDYFIEKVPKKEKDIHEFWNRYKVLMDNQFSKEMFTNFWKELCQFKDSQISSLDLEEKLGSKKIISDYLSTEQSLLHEAVLSSSFEVCKFFVSNVKSLDLTDNDGNTALHLAVKQMNAAIVRLLVDGGANLIATDESGNTPLDLITSKHSSDILLCLLKKMDIFKDYRFKDSLIFHAASFGCLESVKILITSGINGNSEDSEKNTALHFAAQEGHKNIVEYLLNKGSEINLENHKGKTPLMLALEQGHHAIVSILKENSAKPDLRLLQTMLRESVMKNQENVLKSLIEVGVDVNFQDGKTGKTLLHLHLVQNNTFPNPNIIKLLIKAGAIVEQFDNEGNSPLHHASKFEAIFPLLINHCCKINRCNSNKETPLHLALEAKKSFAARLLLFKQACIHLTDTNGNTALHVALKNNHQDVANVLINLDSNVNSQNSKGETPLHLAAISGNLAAARRLIENEAYVTAKTKEGKTVLDYVEKGKMSANVRRLLIKLIETKNITMHEL